MILDLLIECLHKVSVTPIDLIQRMRNRERERDRHRSIVRRSGDRESRRTLSYDAPPFYMPTTESYGRGGGGTGGGSSGGGSSGIGTGTSSTESTQESGDTSLTVYRRQLGERLFPKVQALQPVSPYLSIISL